MTSAFIYTTLVVVLYSLWVRRDTWWSRWEVGASLTMLLQGTALVLMSPRAADELSLLLYRAVHLWNVQHLLGLICLICALAACVYHVMVRVADPDQVRSLMRRHLAIPLCGGVIALVVVFAIGDEGHHTNLLSAPVNHVWLASYWVLACGMVIYLSAYAARVTLILRSDPRAKTTVRLYLAAATLGVAGGLVQLANTWIRPDLTVWAWFCGCLSVAIFAYGSARSWQAKAAWFTSDTAVPQRSDPPPAG